MEKEIKYLSILDDENLRAEVNFVYSEVLRLIDIYAPEIRSEFLRLREIFLSSRTVKNFDYENIISNLELEKGEKLIKIFSLYLMLLNIVEERNEIKNSSLMIDEAIEELKQEGFDKNDILEVLRTIKFYPVFTAHPTESRRRTFLEAHDELSNAIEQIFEYKKDSAIEDFRYRLAILWQSALIRKEKVEVLFELDNLLYIIENSLLNASKTVLDEIEKLTGRLHEPIIRLGSWIGGDRDGNPFVTNDILTKVMKIQHNTIIKIYTKEVDKLLRELAIHTSITKPTDTLMESIELESRYLSDDSIKLHKTEPIRAKLSLMKKKLKNRYLSINSTEEIDFIYNRPSELIDDIDMILDSLDEHSQKRLKSFRNLVLSAGFHLLKLDFREHKLTLHKTITEVFSLIGYADSDFLELSKEHKLEILNKALEQPPIILQDLLKRVTKESGRLIEAFTKIEWAKNKISKNMLDSFIISMTTDSVDLLIVLWFAKQSKLWVSGKKTKISITPLFETIDDLKKAPEIMQELFSNKFYRAYLRDRKNIQEIMIGYSDSSKDGGIFASNFNLNRAVVNLIDLEDKLGIKFLLFHGRGGSVSRGGGPTHEAIMASPYRSVSGFLKVTEQGEVISSKYLNPKIAEFNFKKTLSALLKKSTYDRFNISIDCSKKDKFVDLMRGVSYSSMSAYREFVYETDGFIDYFHEATPIHFISKLNIGSRPSKRKVSDNIGDLRAIPWVFAWTQNRSIIPAWYGVGSGIESVMNERGLDELKECYRQCPLFNTTIDNIAMALMKVDMSIAKLYNQFVKEPEVRDRVWGMAMSEYNRTMELILALREESELLEKEKMLRKSILLRKPYLSALSLFQIDLIKKYQEAKYDELRDKITDQISSTIVGIAQGIRNTG